MAFWGIEVKPGRPYTHLYDNSRGRLRISQATLGNGKSTTKSVVQCNVGNKSPVLLCSVIPNVTETCHLELEFEEDDEVIFSVLGQRSVHLTGFYVGSRQNGGAYDDTEPYGEDIAETETDDSGSYASEDEEDYESDFIDDGDIEMFPPSHRRKSNVVIEEIVEDEKPANGVANHRRSRKKLLVSDSDDGDVGQSQIVVKRNDPTVSESEDEDGFPISFSLRGKRAVKNAEGNAKLDKTLDKDKKRKIGATSHDRGSEGEAYQPCDSSVPSKIDAENNLKSKKKKKEKVKDITTHESDSKLSTEHMVSGDQNQDIDDKEDGVHSDDSLQFPEAKIENKDKDHAVRVDVDGAENSGKLTKKKKERAKKGKASAAGTVSTGRTEEGASGKGNQAISNGKKAKIDDNMDQDLPVKGEPEKLPTDKEMIDSSIPAAAALESSGKLKKKNKKKTVIDGPSQTVDKDEREGDKSDIDENKLTNDKTPDVDPAAVVIQHDAKNKKKKRKSMGHDNELSTNKELSDPVATEAKTDLVEGMEEQRNKSQSLKPRTFSNGLAIEEVSMGKPDGKRASRGSKVSVHYIGKLKNGKIFDSNIGQRPFKFRLGIGQVIKGWDVGVNGMRVGDKRRLTIPPSMGYGEKTVGKIPANSWLVFDIELVDVR